MQDNSLSFHAETLDTTLVGFELILEMQVMIFRQTTFMKMRHLVVLMIILLRLSRRFEKLIRKINLLLMHEKGSFAEKAFSHAQHHGGREEAKAERGVQRKTSRALVSGHLRSLLFHRHIDLAHSTDRAQGAFQTVDQVSRYGHNMTTQNRG